MFAFLPPIPMTMTDAVATCPLVLWSIRESYIRSHSISTFSQWKPPTLQNHLFSSALTKFLPSLTNSYVYLTEPTAALLALRAPRTTSS